VQCGILDISQIYRPLRPFTGTSLLFFFFYRDGKSEACASIALATDEKVIYNLCGNTYVRDEKSQI
jgi:hypothetical protein